MEFFDIFKVDEFKRKIAELESKNASQLCEINKLTSLLTPEHNDVLKLREEIKKLNNEKSKILFETEKEKEVMLAEAAEKKAAILDLDAQIASKKEMIIEMDDTILLQEFGLYEPKYDFQTAEEYKSRLQKVRQNQKDMIREGTAATGSTDWTVNGNQSQGRKMVKDMQKLLLRAFNSECEEIIDKVKYNTFDSALKRITASYEAISKLGTIMNIKIAKPYYDSKIDELTISLEYQMKKQEEKEQQKELRAQMREEAKLQKEIEAERKKIEKEAAHYKNALTQIEAQLNAEESEEKKQELMAKKAEIEASIGDVNKALEDIDYRAANQRAGYVYIISNIGSFGENVYKIGMTRRLDPNERIDELGDASVPFDFDIHAMIFSDDAPKLEAALHKAFEDRKLNLVNHRREFFNVTLDEIKNVVKQNFDKTVEFIDTADAEQYRISKKMKEEKTA